MNSSLREKVNHKYVPDEVELKNLFNLLKKSSKHISKLKNPSFIKNDVGMNHNYTIMDEKKPIYQLKILVRKDYPSLAKIEATYDLLSENENVNQLIEIKRSIFPYGYYLYNYIEGVPGRNFNNEKWIADYCELIIDLKKIELNYFGNLDESFKANSLFEYYQNIDKLVDNSFGGTFNYDFSIWDLTDLGLLEKDYLVDLFGKITKLAKLLPVRTPHLCHGDMSPHNIIYGDRKYLIDWDESRSHYWPSELARYLFFTKEDKEEVKEIFIKNMDGFIPKEEINLIINLEHTYQYLRRFVIYSINSDYKKAILRIEETKKIIKKLLESS